MQIKKLLMIESEYLLSGSPGTFRSWVPGYSMYVIPWKMQSWTKIDELSSINDKIVGLVGFIKCLSCVVSS